MSDVGGGGVRVVVVADPADAAELIPAIDAAGFAVSWSGDGGADTLRRLEAEPPDVVVLAAHLDRGDARSIAESVHDGPHRGKIGVVLVGEESGPVRNALDASNFQVDRFVGRPLAAKALEFAIRAALPDGALVATPRLEPLPQLEPMPSSDGRDAAGADHSGDRHGGPDGDPDDEPDGDDPPDYLHEWIEEATNSAINDFVREAMDALKIRDPEGAAPSGNGAQMVATEVPVAPLREPTLILPDGGVGAVRAPAPVAASEEVTAPQRTPPREPHVAPAVPTGGRAALPSGGSELGRELRAKMTEMAERLFPDRAGAAAEAVDDHARGSSPDIDLAAIGDDATAADDLGDRRGGSDGLDGLAGLDGLDSTVAGPVLPPEPYDLEPNAETHPFVVASGHGMADSGPIAHDATRLDPGSSLRGEFDTGGRGSPPSPQSPPSTDDGRETLHGTTRRRRSSSLVPARGELSERDEDVALLMARLHRAGFSGRLILRLAEAEKRVHFSEGKPVFATSNLPHDRMGGLLYREGKITREQHAQCREVVAESGRRAGEILVEMGFIKRRELLPAVRRHIEDIIYSLFSWTAGEYRTAPGEAAAGEKIRLSRHPGALIVEGIRRKYGLDMLEGRLGREATSIALVETAKLDAIVRDLDLGDAERRVLTQFDGLHTLEQVSSAAQVDRLAVYQLAYGLVVLGMARIADGGDAGANPWEAEARGPSLVGASELAIDRQRLLAKHAHVDEADYFALLGVRPQASAFEIQRAYEAARKDYAAEAFPGELRRELAREIGEIGALIEEAYRVLKDEQLRDAYRSNLQD